MKLIYAGLFSVAMSGAAFAGGLDQPVVEPNVTVEADSAPAEPLMSRETIAADTAAAGSHDIIVPLAALILFGAALAK